MLNNLTVVNMRRRTYPLGRAAESQHQGLCATCCAAFGEGPEEALAEVLKAKAAWLEAAKAEGKPIPSPSFRPVICQLSEERT